MNAERGRPAATGLDAAARAFVDSMRVARLATASAGAVPQVVPVCFALEGNAAYITIDHKPKSANVRALRRLRNIAENPRVSLLADVYAEDWSTLGWVMLHGDADILDAGAEHDRAQTLLRARYPQYRQMAIEALPVIAVRITRAVSWGDLTPLAGRARRE